MSSPTTALLGSRVVAGTAARITKGHLRVLAYHDVPDPIAFDRHLAVIARDWHPVTGADVARAYREGTRLPDRSVWVTFDDGRPTTVTNGLPLLERHEIPATMYVCPGVIEGSASFWWQEIEIRPDASAQVGGRTLAGRPLVKALKQVPDDERRSIMEVVRAAPTSVPPPDQLTHEQLRAWVTSGREIGNHTWDHPILDQCSPAAQTDQLERTHAWLSATLGEPPTLFAYPNGDPTDHVARELARLGYESAPLFDHRLASAHQDRFHISRLRVDADAPADRFRAILSGAHSGLFHATDRLRNRRGSR